MIYLYYAMCAVVFFAGFAMTVREGVWHNLLLLCYLLLSSAIAFGFYQPVTIWLDEWSGGTLTYFWDYIVFWGLFALSVSLLKVLGVTLSGTQVKFLHPIEQYAGPALGAACGLAMASIAAVSLHLAPFPKDFLGGAVVHDGGAADSPTIFTGAPDLAFLAVAQMVTSPTGIGGGGQLEPGPWVEDYAGRRDGFEKVMKASKSAFALKVVRNKNR
jgi:hypothetical protein